MRHEQGSEYAPHAQAPETINPQCIDANVQTLASVIGIIDGLTDADYTARLNITPDSTIGMHIRHILDYYSCYLRGLDRGLIDYDLRERNLAIETNKVSAIALTTALQQRLGHRSADVAVNVKTRLMPQQAPDPVSSTAARELVFLQGHAIHHLAIIAIMMQSLGKSPDPVLGVAASTLSYREQNQLEP